MQNETAVISIAHAIQLAVAPVFLLTGIAALLGVLANRLARVVDRARALEGRLEATPPTAAGRLHQDLRLLARRARVINRGIAAVTVAALLICTLIVVLFVDVFFGWELTRPVALLFVAAMAALIFGLLSLLREVQLATAGLRIGPADS
ncbi:MAG: DUF2721 domain-containing protein [Gammaproteobacteria bacterium]|nr:DUF2721 domain-containing protein [Gammaproteobacteria bacterium]